MNRASSLAALDIGTNSFHLVVARPAGDGGFETLTREKEVVRLGHGGGDMKEMSPDADRPRASRCLRRMRRIADSYGAPLRAVATSAVREAVNAAEFIERARREAGVEIEVISGVEEARLIHLGVLQAVPVFDQRLLLVDIGGGSTELLIGERGETLAARSFKLGAVRLTDRFFPGGVRRPEGGHAVPGVRPRRSSATSSARSTEHGFDVAVASSGTAEAVARMVHAATGAEPLRTYNCFEFTTAELAGVVAELAVAPHGDRTRQGARPRGRPGRHHRRRRADPRERGDDVRRRAPHVQRGRAARGRAARHGRRGSTDGRAAPCTTCATCRGAASGSSPSAATTTRRTPPTSPASPSSCSTRSAPLHGLDAAARATTSRPGAAGQRRARGLPQQAPPARLLRDPQQRAGRASPTARSRSSPRSPATTARASRSRRTRSSPPSARADQALVRTLAGILRVAIGLDRSHARRVRRCAPRCTRSGSSCSPSPRRAPTSTSSCTPPTSARTLLEQVLDRRVELIAGGVIRAPRPSPRSVPTVVVAVDVVAGVVAAARWSGPVAASSGGDVVGGRGRRGRGVVRVRAS